MWLPTAKMKPGQSNATASVASISAWIASLEPKVRVRQSTLLPTITWDWPYFSTIGSRSVIGSKMRPSAPA